VARLGSVRQLVILLGTSATVLAAYIANSPRLDRFGDSPTYEFVANDLPRSFVNSARMPGYPVLIAVSSWLPGGREVGLIVTQAILILASVLATYLIARAALGHQWLAFLVAFIVATDLLLAGYVRVVMSETLAVALTQLLIVVTLRFMLDFQARYLWVMAGLTVALTLTRAEWALVMLVLVPYLFVIAHRRRLLNRTMVTHGVAGAAAVFVALGAYCTVNLVEHGYFGLSSYSNVALLGKVKVYGMVHDAPAPYSAWIPMVNSYQSVWDLVTHPPFNDANSVLAGEFARAAILRDPLRFAQDVLGSAISSAGEHDSQFLVIHGNSAFGRPLQVLLVIDQLRYRGFVILPALAIAWVLTALIVPAANRVAQVLGLLGLVALYSWLTTAAGTFGEFERLRMTVNPIGTAILFGTLGLLVIFAFRHRDSLIPALGLVAVDLAAIGLLPHLSSTVAGEAALLALAGIHTFAFVRWFGSPSGTTSLESAAARPA
jgi:hypothetical protein